MKTIMGQSEIRRALLRIVQEIIEKINVEWAAKHGDAWDTSDLIGIQFFLSKGGTIYGIDSKEAARWEKAVAPVTKDFIADMKKKGFSDPEKYVDFVKTALKTYQK